ncbi:MAG: HD domain-containing phosphohydrolase [Negativicutes bacterium]|nr:HD domain-containing phosphohydrolase [Negativicutes bacterium]
MNDADILIVDDDEMVVNALRRTLSMHGYQSVGITNPGDAIRTLQEREIAIIICDQRMPCMSGVKVLLKAREVSPNTVRILMTGYADIDAIIAAINDGQIFRYIAKPWNESELMAIIQQAVIFRNQSMEKEYILQRTLKDKEDWKLTMSQLCLLIDQSMKNAVNTLQKIMQVKDNELLQHNLRVSEHAGRIASLMGLSIEQKANLEYASKFHDIGKIAIQDQILYKSGRLDENEFLSMKLHPAYGAEILRELGFLDPVAEIVLQHHEKYDGSGYPSGLQGDQILLEARILSAVDAYDALLFKRVYRAELPREEVHKILDQESGTHFDPQVVKCVLGE